MAEKPSDKENNTLLYAGLAGAALLLIGAIVAMKFMLRPPPPPPPPPPPAPEVSVTQTMKYTPGFYRATLHDDAEAVHLAVPTLEELAAPLHHDLELANPRTLKPGEAFETEHLKVSTQVVKAWAKGESGQGFRYEHLVLSIENKSGTPLAYRVDTTLDHPEKCRSKGSLAQNAIALAAHEKTQRTECLFHENMTIKVNRVETVTLPALGYYYVSRLDPTQIGLEGRTSAGHTVPAKLNTCSFVPWRDIEAGGASWADVVDFYARHNCDQYFFFRTYRFRTAAGPLPAREDRGEAAAAPTR